MKLLLTSAGLTNNAIRQELKSLIGQDFSQASCVLIPTAIHAERGDKRWKLSNSSEIMAINWKSIEIIDLAVSDKEEVGKVIAAGDVVVFGGGNPNYLAAEILKKFSSEEFMALMRKKVYVGISAGSMVVSKHPYFNRAWEFYGEQKTEAQKGLGWCDFYLLPHYDESSFAKTICRESGVGVYALGDENALSVDLNGKKVRIIEEPRWEKFGMM